MLQYRQCTIFLRKPSADLHADFLHHPDVIVAVQLSIAVTIVVLSHTPPLLLGTLFLSRSALLIMSLLSDPELNHTFSVLPTNCLNVSVVNVICFPQSFISCTVGWVGVFAMFCQCSVTVTMFRNNVLQQCICNLLYACNRLCAPWTLEK